MNIAAESTITKPSPMSRYSSGPAIVLYIAAAALMLHLLTAARYGIFRDEMYYLACSHHMAWGYVDHPPLTVLIAWIGRHLLGESLVAVRLIPVLAGAALVCLTGALAREMGGGRFAQATAALAVVVAPMNLIMLGMLTDNVFEQLIWMGCVWLVIRAINTGNERYWLWFGVLAGVGFQNKYSIAFLLLGLLVGVALTPERKFLKSRYLWLGVLACAAIALPNLVWQIRNHFPFLELMHNVRMSGRDIARAPLAFIVDQMMVMNPLVAPLWIGGVFWLFFGSRGKRYRVLGWCFLVVLITLMAMKAKNYYVTPIYPMLFAAGAIAFENLTAAKVGFSTGAPVDATRRVRNFHLGWMRYAYLFLVVLGGAMLTPFCVPVLSPENFLAYENRLGLKPPEIEHQNNGPLPQWFADEFGWEEMVREVARVYHSLSAEEQKRTAIFSNGWGEAAAVDYFGPRYGLPHAISKHNSYWIWGPGNYDGSSMIILRSKGRHEPEEFQSVEDVGSVGHPYARRDEHFHIFLCRGLKVDLRKAWPSLKQFD
ncbi:MAG TPA: glycosyltransferase family 39 protein [Candidatus Angelobacter sp.]|nr:glycosyltransferase family 39 protein [Candidatus Angelobacter sp.]